VAPDEFGDQIDDWVRMKPFKPATVRPGMVEASIIHIDRFGNCVTNLSLEHLDSELKDATIVVNDREITSRRRFFAELEDTADDVFCVHGSAGFWELVVKNGSAAEVLKVTRGQRVTLLTKHN